jgi:hypothetical protein
MVPGKVQASEVSVVVGTMIHARQNGACVLTMLARGTSIGGRAAPGTLVALHMTMPLLQVAMQINCKPRLCGAHWFRESISGIASFPLMRLGEALAGSVAVNASWNSSSAAAGLALVGLVGNSFFAGLLMYLLVSLTIGRVRHRHLALATTSLVASSLTFAVLYYVLGDLLLSLMGLAFVTALGCAMTKSASVLAKWAVIGARRFRR